MIIRFPTVLRCYTYALGGKNTILKLMEVTANLIKIKKKKKNILEKPLKALVLMFYRNVYVICLTEISVFHLLDAIIDLF